MWLDRSLMSGLAIGKLCLCLTFIGFLPGSAGPVFGKDSLRQAGWVERVIIFPGSIALEAKLDTGALSSSLHAENVSIFSRDGKRWVKFEVPQEDGKPIAFELNLHRTVKIKRHNQESTKRPVVLLGICLGNQFEETEVNLADRSNYKYPLLIGRMFLADRVVVDASQTHLLKSDCPGKNSQ